MGLVGYFLLNFLCTFGLYFSIFHSNMTLFVLPPKNFLPSAAACKIANCIINFVSLQTLFRKAFFIRCSDQNLVCFRPFFVVLSCGG